MVVRHHVKGDLETFLKFMEGLPTSSSPTHVLFSGTKLAESGQSWCSDCVEAEPSIEKGIQKAPEQSLFVHVEVGDRPYWKDPQCPYRTSPQTKLKNLPTLVKWGTQKRLEGDECLNVDLIEMLVTDEDDE